MRAPAVAAVALAAAILCGASPSAARADSPKCERAADGFEGVTVIGSFANDLGCVWQAYIFDGQKHALMDAGVLLGRRGWSDTGQRVGLARSFVRGVLLDRGVLLERAPDGFTGKFVAPHATAAGDGSVLFAGWRRLPAGMRPGTRYARVEIYFASDGNIKNVRNVEMVTVK